MIQDTATEPLPRHYKRQLSVTDVCGCRHQVCVERVPLPDDGQFLIWKMRSETTATRIWATPQPHPPTTWWTTFTTSEEDHKPADEKEAQTMKFSIDYVEGA